MALIIKGGRVEDSRVAPGKESSPEGIKVVAGSHSRIVRYAKLN